MSSNTEESHFLSIGDFPPEIMRMIASHLPPSSQLSLSYTCTALSSILNVSATSLLGRPSKRIEPWPPERIQYPDRRQADNQPTMVQQTRQQSSSVQPRDEWRGERLELLYMLDRDGMWAAAGKAACGACCTVHDKGVFLRVELSNDGSVRRACKAGWGVVRVGEHVQLDDRSLKETYNSNEAWETMMGEEELHSRSKTSGERVGIEEWKKRMNTGKFQEAEAETRRKAWRAAKKKNKEWKRLEEERRLWTQEVLQTCRQCPNPVTRSS